MRFRIVVCANMNVSDDRLVVADHRIAAHVWTAEGQPSAGIATETTQSRC